ncbi:thioesterase family protein [Rhodotorula paludigena]|uniref:thioesterase family protein n=1 Tax=Rhodotorula paludigena TaxID=86838 RepID=UPI00316F15DA
MGVLHLPAPATIAVGAAATALLAADSSSLLASLVKKLLAVLLVLNWRSLPFSWHIGFWRTVPELYVRIWRRGEERAMAIARDPFEVKSVTEGRVGFSEGDYNFHMSNSSYGKVSDAARFRYLLELVGPAMGFGIWSPLAATAYSFYREIPLGAKYEIESRIVSWDDKWLYYLSRFTTAPKKGSKERTLCCISFQRSCFKLRGSRLTIPPARVLALSGVGPDRSNWERTLALKKAGRVRQWLEYGGALVAQKQGKWNGPLPSAEPGWEHDGLEMYEEKRLERLPVAQRFGETQDWVDL